MTRKNSSQRARRLASSLAGAAAIALQLAQPVAAQTIADQDGDGVSDRFDNCLTVPNPPKPGQVRQTDTDLDGFGNACDGDYDQNGAVTTSDFTRFIAAFNGLRDDAELIDADDNGVVTTADFSLFVGQFQGQASASGLACADATLVVTSPKQGCVSDEYQHPIVGSALEYGAAPVYEVSDSLAGHRFAIENRAAGDETHATKFDSEIVELTRAVPDPEDRTQRALERLQYNGGEEKTLVDGVTKVIDDGLLAAMAQSPPGTIFEVSLRVAEPPSNVVDDLMRELSRVPELSTSEAQEIRAGVLVGRQEAIAAAQQPVIEQIVSIGGEITHQYQNLSALDVQLDASQIEMLTANVGVVSMDLNTEGVDDIDGLHTVRGTQTAQFINSGYDGENGSGTDITFAVIETTKVHDDHDGFDETGTAGERIRARYECSDSLFGGCSFTSNFTSPGSHATEVSSIIFGDLRDGQDASITGTTERRRKSGIAGEGRGYLYQADSSNRGKRRALDHVIGRSVTPHVANLSWSNYGHDTDCEGDTAFAKDANDLFENGTLLFKSAGNRSGSASNCTIGSPGAAIGVFTVGGHGNSSFSDDYLDVKTAEIYSNSSMGGVSSSEGLNRSIVDMTAYACREDVYDTAGGYSGSGCGTSYSTPTAAAAAMVHVDHYKNNWSDLIDQPGVLFAQMLMMGDRQGQSGTMSSGFDSLWGSGRLQMRKLDSDGLDGPWGWGTGYTCVDDGETVTLSVNGGATLSSDVDYLKAVAYWMDPRHEKGRSVSDIDLRLKTTGGTTLRSSLDYYDNKERVFSRGVGGSAVKLELDGWDVKTDSTACGRNSMLVYYAWFYEDDDRDDSDGPGSLIDVE